MDGETAATAAGSVGEQTVQEASMAEQKRHSNLTSRTAAPRAGRPPRRCSGPPVTVLTLVALLAAALPALAAGTPTATYQVTFLSTWSSQTHPIDWPSSAHFSGPIGGTHDGQVRFWNEGQLASPGIKKMAEQGRQSPLDEEVGAAITAGHAGEIIRGLGIDSPGDSVTMTFTATEELPLVTLVAMVAPSPDWFVGVSGLSLQVGGDWVEGKVVQLLSYDAGTDSGPTFKSPNQATIPPVPVHRIDDGPLGNGVPVGTFTFVRLDSPPAPALSLNGGRFEVTATWETRDGTRAFARPEALTDDSGYFWFFKSTNVEMIVKVLDACTFSGHYWVFAAGLTNVGVELRVDDTQTGAFQVYTNPVDTAYEPLQDTRAFATCP